MAVADANYKFIYVDVGAYGSEGDSAVFRSSDFWKGLVNNKITIPVSKPLFGKLTPHFFVADDAFPLHKHILKPYKPKDRKTPLSLEERIFNYR